MKYVITGGAGNISKPLAEKLLAAKHEVVVIGRNAGNLKELVAKGAKAAIGAVEDRNFLTTVFSGADAIYTMVPPNFTATNWKAYIGSIGANYAAAARAAGVQYIVNLSSVGADQPEGCGPVTGLHKAEQELNTLDGAAILHLRPGYFYNNFLANIPMVKNMQIIGSNFGGNDRSIVLSAPVDIAEAAAEALLQLNFIGHSAKYLAGDECPASAIALAIGTAIGNSNLPWVCFTDQQMNEGLLAAGLPPEIATNYVEMGAAIASGLLFEDFQKHRPAVFGKTRLEGFAKDFAQAYAG